MWNFPKEASQQFLIRYPASSGGTVSMSIKIKMRNKIFSDIFRTKLSVKQSLFFHQFTGNFLNELVSTASLFFKIFSPLSLLLSFAYHTYKFSTITKRFLGSTCTQIIIYRIWHSKSTEVVKPCPQKFFIPEFFRSVPLLEKFGKDKV